MSDFDAPGFDVGETWYLDMASGEWSQTPPAERRPPGRGVITKVTETTVTFDAAPAIPTEAPTTKAPGNRRARRAAAARLRRSPPIS